VRDLSARLSRLLIAMSAWLVPSSARERFRQEWDGELFHRANDLNGRDALRRSAGAVPHAVVLLTSEWRWDTMFQDLHYALRTLIARPLFVLAAASTLAIGIGANTALFSILDAVILRPLPYPEPSRLVAVFESHLALGGTNDGPAPGNVIDWNTQSTTLEGIAAWWVESTTLMGDDAVDTVEVPSAKVTADFFPVLGVEPLIGRTFIPDEVEGEPRIAVVGYDLWMRRFGGDRAVVGRDVRFKNEVWRIIGVMPTGFRTPGTLPGEVQLWKPWDLEMGYGSMPDRARDHRFLRSAARIAEASSVADAQAEMDVIADAIAAEHPKTNEGWGVSLVPLRESLIGDTRTAFFVLLGAVGFVLLLACANVTSLLLVRASGRTREMAVRTALGASRLRLSRQLFLESVTLAAIGGAAGVVLSRIAVTALVRFAPAGIPRIEDTALDGRVFLFGLCATLASGLLAGIGPAFQGSTAIPSHSLKNGVGAVSSERRRRQLRTVIVTGEVAVAIMLLVGAGLFLQSFSRVLGVSLGFDPENLLVVRMRLDGKVYGGGGADGYYRRFLEEIRALPGVVSAGGTTGLPMDALDIDFERPYWRDGEPRPDGGGTGVQVRMATDGYFEAMRIPLLRGREVDSRDDRDKPRVAIVNETMAEQSWPGESAVGKRLFIDYQNYETVYEVVGVIGDTRFYGHKNASRRAVYIPHAQNPYLPLNIVIRANGNPQALAPAIRERALDLDPSQPVHSIQTMAALMGGHVGRDRFAALLMTAFASMAVLLATIGVYSIVAFSVSQRRRELGLRMALGARSADVERLVLKGGLRIAATGGIIGLVGALLGSRYLESLLFGVSATDPLTLGAASATLAVTVLAACYLPARRAARVDPTETLRYE